MERNTLNKLNAMQKGAAGEVLAAAYFSSQGDNIFWPLPGFTKCDFVRETPQGELRKVQVKYASWNNKSSGKHSYLHCNLGKRPTQGTEFSYVYGDFDDMFFLSDDGRAWCIPYFLIKDRKSLCLDSTNKNYDYEKHGVVPDFWLLEDYKHILYKGETDDTSTD